MEMKVEKVLEDGAYDAKLVNVEQKETKFGDRLMWTFQIDGENTEIVGFTSMSPSTKVSPSTKARVGTRGPHRW
jgi:hypothetical protein